MTACREEYRSNHDTIEKAVDSLRVRIKDLEVRTTLKSDDVPSVQRSADDETTSGQIRREIAEVSAAVRLREPFLRNLTMITRRCQESSVSPTRVSRSSEER